MHLGRPLRGLPFCLLLLLQYPSGLAPSSAINSSFTNFSGTCKDFAIFSLIVGPPQLTRLFWCAGEGSTISPTSPPTSFTAETI